MRLVLMTAAMLAAPLFANEIAPVSGVELRPDAGSEIGLVFEAWLSPHQEGGEEEDTPAVIPDVFRSTEPSVPRAERTSRGHGTLAFARDFSKAYAHLKIENVNPEDIVMFHIHCGKPGQLGPIIVDFGINEDLQAVFEDGELSLEIANEDLVDVVEHSHGVVGAITSGCLINPSTPLQKVHTIAGMASIAIEHELYFNLHTKGQTYFGDIRGQLYPIAD